VKLASLFFRKGEKLSIRLLFWILLLSSIFTLIATTIQIYLDYRESRQTLEISLQQVEETALPAVAVAMWNLDKEVMESILDGLLTQPDILYLEVVDTYNHPIIQLGDIEVKNSLERLYPIMYTNDAAQQIKIGQLKVVATLAEIYRKLMDKVVVILLTQGVKTFLMSICILVLVERLVIRHLNSLAKWAYSVELENPNELLILPRGKSGEGDVIDSVTRAINTMQLNLIQALLDREKAERLTKSIVENTSSLIYAKDPQGSYTMVNQQFLTALGLNSDKVIGHTDSQLFSENVANALRHHDLIVTQQAKPVTFDEEVMQQGQVEYYVSVKFPIFDDNQKLSGTGGVSTNITDRHQKEQQILELNESLEAKVEERTKALQKSVINLELTQAQLVESEKMSALGGLVSGVAHEINTPLGVSVTAASHLVSLVNGFESEYKSGNLKRSFLENYMVNIKESSDILTRNLDRAANLVQNFKQIAADQSREVKRQFEIKTYIEEVIGAINPKFKTADHTITIEAENPITLDSYPGAIAKIITDLIMNSITHGFKDVTEGEIKIKLTQVGGSLEINYQDNGVGLDAQQLEKVFEPFYTTTRGSGDSGLGMSICYNLVTHMLGGRIKCIESATGAHFNIHIPLVS